MNCAIVGLGKIGIMHTAMVSSIAAARVAALVDQEPKLGRHVQSMMAKPAPFFASIEEAMQTGYTTSGGLGLGLPGTKRLMDEFEIASEVGKGTRVTVRKWRRL